MTLRRHIGIAISGVACWAGLLVIAPQENFMSSRWWIALAVICFGNAIGEAVRDTVTSQERSAPGALSEK